MRYDRLAVSEFRATSSPLNEFYLEKYIGVTLLLNTFGNWIYRLRDRKAKGLGR